MKHLEISKNFPRTIRVPLWIMVLVTFPMLSSHTFGDEEVNPSKLLLVGVSAVDGVAYASLVDSQSGACFLTSTRTSAGGLALVAITSDQGAIIQQNEKTFLFRLDETSAGTVPVNMVATPIVIFPNIPPGKGADLVPTPPPRARLPLVFQSVDPHKLNLTDAQKALISRLQQQFLAAIGEGSGASTTASQTASVPVGQADPNSVDPSLDPPFQNWLTAQEKSDAVFQMEFGMEAFNLYSMALQSKSAQ